MMDLKKRTALVLCASMLLALCVSCGAKEKGETPAPAETVDIEGGLQIGRALGAAHGAGCFTQAFAVVRDDVIVASWVDDFQFVDTDMGLEAVPNSDKGLGEGYAEGKALTSKRLVADAYSQIMAEKGGSTVPINVNFDAIQSYTVGKTIGELDSAAADPKVMDAVSGATLVDTAGYLKVIAEAAKNAQETQGVEFSGNSADLRLTAALGAAHGEGCFTSAVALTEGDRIILCYVDDYQFLDRDTGAEPVPNSDAAFGENIVEGKVLTTKRLSAKIYSQVMAEKGGSTVPIDVNFDAIQRYAAGKTTAELDSAAADPNVVDAVSGATLVDTAGYLKVIADTARAGK